MANKVFLAVDLGASSGRVVAGVLTDGRLQLDEIHRFANGPVRIVGRHHWDLLALWSNVKDGLRAAASKYGGQIVSVGVDTWGVDYGLLGPGDELLGNPYHYRDFRTQGIFDRAFEIASREEIFAQTGLQFLEFNTLYQLLAAKLAGSPILDAAESLLLMPDLFHWLLTGKKANEQTDASTTQLYNPQSGTWSAKLIERFGLPAGIFGSIVPPGTRLGRLLPDVAKDANLADVYAVLPGTHDTASAVYAVPVERDVAGGNNEPSAGWCFLSSGTWSLMGVETHRPHINAEVASRNFTNEAGVGGKTRLLKNIAGLWLVQECRRIWQHRRLEFGWDELVRKADDAPPLAAVINPDDPRLVAPEDMPATIAQLCQETGQPVPETPGATIRCALESLALRYRQVLDSLEQITGTSIDTIHVVGGGAKNELLNQLTADACGRRVVAGPVEATAIGNVMVQAQTAGEVANHAEARELIRRSFETKSYEPGIVQRDRWQAAAERVA